jgi:nucleotide-binding universal stress UspA family protein
MYQHILVAVDGSQSSRLALDEAIQLAKLTRASLQAVNIVDKTPLFSYAGYYDPIALADAIRQDGRNALEAAEKACADAGVECEAELIETESLGDDVASTLQRYVVQKGADLVVMGTHGRRGVRRIVIGSVAERLLRVSTCPVMLVRDAATTDHAGEQKV